MNTAKFIPMETKHYWAPGEHQKAYLATAGSDKSKVVCGDTFETLCDNCKSRQGQASYAYEREKDGRKWISRVVAYSESEARKTLRDWAGRSLTFI